MEFQYLCDVTPVPGMKTIQRTVLGDVPLWFWGQGLDRPHRYRSDSVAYGFYQSTTMHCYPVVRSQQKEMSAKLWKLNGSVSQQRQPHAIK